MNKHICHNSTACNAALARQSPLLHCAFGEEHSMMLVCISNAICSPSWQVQCICPVVLEAAG